MIKELELVCLYKVTLDTTSGIYSFTTKNNISYDVIFNDAVEYFQGTTTYGNLSNIYSLILEKRTDVIEPLDREVQNTVDAILQHFFEDTSNSLLYICQTKDGKGLKRFNKFNKWYDDSLYNVNLEKKDELLYESNGTINYTSLIYHTENPFKDSLENAHTETIKVLKAEKNKKKIDSFLKFLCGGKG